METSLIIDLIFAGVFLLCVYFGARSGFVKFIATFAAVVVSLALSFFIVGKCAPPLADKYVTPFIANILGEEVQKRFPDADSTADTIMNVVDKAGEVVDGLIGKEKTEEEAEEDTVSGMDGLLLTLSEKIGGGLTAFILFVLVYALISAILRVIIDAAGVIDRIPVVGTVNTLLGLLLGALLGAVLIVIPVWVATRFLPGLFRVESIIAPETLEKSRVVAFLLKILPL